MNATAASTFELPLSDDAAWLLGTWSSLEVPFWGTVLLIKLVCERLGLGKKIQPTKTPPPELVAKTLRETLLNHALVHPVLIWFTYVPWLKVGGLPVSAVLPTVAQAAIQVAVWIFVNDTLFYFTHRLLHTRLLYKRFHKQHHEFHVSIAMAAEYATPFEAVVSNITPLLVGPVVWTRYVSPVHPLTLWLFFALRIWETCDAHCGYEMPFPFAFPFSDVKRHDWHHSANNGNYGGFTLFWDWALGTDAWGDAQKKLKHKAL